MQPHGFAIEGRHLTVDEGVRQLLHFAVDLVHLEEDRAWVERIERQKVGHRQARCVDVVAAAVGHDAVADFEQHVERAIGRLGTGHMAEKPRHVQPALDIAPERQEAPAGEAIHVLVHEAGKTRKLAQEDRHGVAGVVAVLHPLLETAGGLGEIGQRQPAVRGKAVANVAGRVDGAVDVAQQAFRYGFLGVYVDGGQIGGDVGEQRLVGIGGFGEAPMPGAQDAQGPLARSI